MAQVQRRCALRIACAYRTVSKPAVLVIAGVIPIRFLAQERKYVYICKGDVGKKQASQGGGLKLFSFGKTPGSRYEADGPRDSYLAWNRG